jgi:hypothetical protein
VKSPVSIALFFLLSGLFLSLLLGAIERSRKLLAIAAGLLVAVVCVIIILTPVRLPNWGIFRGDDKGAAEATAGSTTTLPSGSVTTTTVTPVPTATTGQVTPVQRPSLTTLDTTVTTGGPLDVNY